MVLVRGDEKWFVLRFLVTKKKSFLWHLYSLNQWYTTRPLTLSDGRIKSLKGKN